MTIHHATAKRADKLNIELVENDDGTVTAILDHEKEDGTNTSTSPQTTAKAALDEAIRIQDLIDAGDYDPDADDEVATSSIVKSRYRQRYKEAGDPDSCGDDVAAEFKNYVTTQNDKGKDVLDMVALRQVAKDNDLEPKLDEWLNKSLNNGQCRMNLGNMIRKKFRDGDTIIFGNFQMVPEFEDAEADVS